MLKILLVILLAGLVSSCAMEDPDASGVLVDPNSDTEVPEGLTARDFDFNKDGVIDILDLVIVSKFIGQEVLATNLATNDDEPCQNIENMKEVTSPDIAMVDDNTDFKEIFETEGNKYAYALLAVTKSMGWALAHEIYYNLPDAEREKEGKLFEHEKHKLPSCIAIRLLINDDFLPIGMKIKSVAGYKYSQITDPLFLKITPEGQSTHRLIIDEEKNPNLNIDEKYKRDRKYDSISIMSNESVNRYRTTSTASNADYWIRVMKRKMQLGIPIGGSNVITKLHLHTYTHPSRFMKVGHNWGIGSKPTNLPFSETYSSANDWGIYIKMLPVEVRRRYFPEDIE